MPTGEVVVTDGSEIYLSVIQRKVLTPNDFADLAEVESGLLAFSRRYEQTATPFEWRFSRGDLTKLLERTRRKARPQGRRLTRQEYATGTTVQSTKPPTTSGGAGAPRPPSALGASTGEPYVFGGGAMVLGHNAREATMDLDAAIRRATARSTPIRGTGRGPRTGPSGLVAERAGDGLPASRLRRRGDNRPRPSGLTVIAASPRHLPRHESTRCPPARRGRHHHPGSHRRSDQCRGGRPLGRAHLRRRAPHGAEQSRTRRPGRHLGGGRLRLLPAPPRRAPDPADDARSSEAVAGLATLRLPHRPRRPGGGRRRFYRRHAVVELAIRDLKEGAGLEHVPSGNFSANGALLCCAVLAHNLIRWTTTIGRPGPVAELTVARTVRTQLIAMPARLVNRSGTPTLRASAGWPWARQLDEILTRLRALEPAPG